ncbi:MAG: bifunctional oligoribonuclease/PAP phosphatase NrnA [Clostridiales bacterium]|nr:bifunctional oligoribonuclease/PAP phosphatase NrnA [Clostridiales bacterium]
MFQEALKLIEKYDVIVIHRHSNPDGDALGSQIGLREIIRENFPNKTVYIVGDRTKRYAFMEGWEPDEIPDEVYNGALAIVLDTSAKFMISDTRYTLAAATLRFDHHIFCESICDVDVIDSTFESCCGLLTQFAVDCNLRLNTLAAKSLFTGMVTDSGRFRYDSANSRTFRLASVLTEQNFDTNEIYAELYADEFASVKLRAEYTLKIQLAGDGVAYIVTTKEELQQLISERGVDSFAISRGMVGTMSDIRGIDSWVNFTETNEGVLCELRSKRYNINPIAVKYGGGGHAKASGATVPDLETAMKMVEDIKALHRQAKGE